MTFSAGPVLDFGAFHRATSVDPATTAGVVIADLHRSEEPTRLRSRKTGAYYRLAVRHFAAPRGREYRTACLAYDKPYSGPMTILMESQYIGVNPTSSAHVIESRTRWTYAFELAAPHDLHGRTYAPEIVMVPASVWQAARLGLPSQAGRAALKIASNLSAETAVQKFGLAQLQGPVVDDEADALNMFLWWLDIHMTGVPRRFMTAAERARR